MVTITVKGTIFFIILHLIIFLFSEYMDILTFNKIVSKNKKSIFITYMVVDNIILFILVILAFLCSFKLKSFLFFQSLNLSYLIISIIILIFIAIFYYFIFTDYKNNLENKNLLIIIGNIISHILNNFIFIPEFICIKLLIKQKIEEIYMNEHPVIPIAPQNINNNSNSCADTSNSVNKKSSNIKNNDDKKEETIFVFVGGNKDNKNKKTENQNIDNSKLKREIKGDDGTLKSIDLIINKIQACNNNRNYSNRVLLKKIDLKKNIGLRKGLKCEKTNLELENVETDNNMHNCVKSTENIINKIDENEI